MPVCYNGNTTSPTNLVIMYIRFSLFVLASIVMQGRCKKLRLSPAVKYGIYCNLIHVQIEIKPLSSMGFTPSKIEAVKLTQHKPRFEVNQYS